MMGTRMREMGRTAVHDGNKTGKLHKIVDPLKSIFLPADTNLDDF